MSFSHNEIDKKWQHKWEEHKCFHCQIDHKKKKFYALDMFPYPSGAGLHVGHLASYMPGDIVSRYKRAKGFNVLHPIGYDAFGLPAEQYAIQTGIHPKETTQKAIQNFKRQLKSFGFSFDWSREVSTCDPSYYQWTQKLFLHFFYKKLAYRKKAPVNWCPQLRTVLANEEVVDGKSERGGYEVYKKNIDQWMLKITQYADILQKDLEGLDWPKRTKESQKNWIGKSYGALVSFSIKDSSDLLQVFTSRPDTLFGVTFMVISPEHPLIEKEFSHLPECSKVLKYREQSRIAKADHQKDKNEPVTGVFSGAMAIHPLTKKEIPIWVADYVLMDYGTGAIMAVPAHDQRDFLFAKKFQIPIQPVMEHQELPYEGDGKHIHSSFLNGLLKKEAIQKMLEHLESHQIGVSSIQYKLRDWIFSRQRYWGEPFPLFYKDSEVKAIPEEELPVQLPNVADYEPSEKGESPIARIQSFVQYKDECKRETDTMPGSAASSWYFLRYTDPHNSKAPFDFEAQKYWMPVDLYVGGAEHTVGHLLYSRFWQKVLYEEGLVSHKEPFKKLVHQGSILGSDGHRMSKSRGNTVNPDQIRSDYGADATRLYIAFMGPFDKDKPWCDQGIGGCRRFLDRIWRLVVNEKDQLITHQGELKKELKVLLHQTIKKVSDDIESMSFNTAISAMMIFVNEMYLHQSHHHQSLKTLLQLLQPFAPHFSEELWQKMGEDGFVSLTKWPVFDEKLVMVRDVQLAIQVNGKLKSTIQVSKDAQENEVVAQAKLIEKVNQALKEKVVKKIIYRPGRILNFVIG